MRLYEAPLNFEIYLIMAIGKRRSELFLPPFCTYFLNLPIYHKYGQSSEMTTYRTAKRIRCKHLPYLQQPRHWGRAGWQIGFSHFRRHNVTPSHCSIHYVLPWEWEEVHAENRGRKWRPARRGKMDSVIIPTPPRGNWPEYRYATL